MLPGPDSYEKAVARAQYIIKATQDFGADGATAQGAAQDLHGHAPVRQGVVHLRGAGLPAQADAEETQFYEQYKQKGFVRAKARLTDEMWAKNIFHPDEDRFIAPSSRRCARRWRAVKAREHKHFGLKRKDKRDPTTDQLLFSKVFNYVSQVLNVPQPELYLRPEQPGELDLANAREKAAADSVVRGRRGAAAGAAGEGAGVRHRQEADPHAARALRALAALVPTVAELKVVFLAALKLVQPNFPVKPDCRQPVAQYLRRAAQAGAAAAARAAGAGGAAVHRHQGRGRPAAAGRTRSI